MKVPNAFRARLEPGQRVDHFKVLRLLGKGGMGVLHRDLKPENVLLASDGRLRVLDFGLAKEVEEDLTAVEIDSAGWPPPSRTAATPSWTACAARRCTWPPSSPRR